LPIRALAHARLAIDEHVLSGPDLDRAIAAAMAGSD
jgi:hypothetical protein